MASINDANQLITLLADAVDCMHAERVSVRSANVLNVSVLVSVCMCKF